MTTKTRWPHAEALKIAEEIKEALAHHCERIEIAGSIRRKKSEVGDIELLFVPKLGSRQAGLFDNEEFDIAGEIIDGWLRDAIFAKRPAIDGRTTWGPKNKLAIHQATGIAVDFFATTAENWWVSLVIRTGGKATNLKLTNGAIAKGAHLNAYGSGLTLQNKKIIPATSERHVFELCGVPYQEPEFRE